MIGKLTRLTTRLLATLFAVFATSSAWAATKVAEWDADFSTLTRTTGDVTCTLDLNGNTLSQNNSTITIGTSGGVKVDFSTSSGSGTGMSGTITVLFKYSDLNASLGSEQTMATVAISGSDNRAGIILESSGQTSGLEGGKTINSSGNGGTASPRETLTATESSGHMAFTYTKPGVYLYRIDKGDITTLYGWGGLGSSTAWNFTGVSIGGNRGSATNGGPATGMKITGIAIFSGTLTQAEMSAYYFPSEDPTAGYDYVATISSNTDLSDITNWTKGSGTPGTDSNVYIKSENNSVLTISGSVDYGYLLVNGGSVTLANGANIGSTRVLGAQINVAESATATITGSTVLSAISCGNGSTVNIENSAINGGLLAPQNYNVTINTSGTVSFSGSVQNKFYSGSRLIVVSGTTTCNSSSNQIFSDGYVEISKGATLVNNRDDMFNWSGTVHVHVKGTLTMNQKSTVGANNYIHLYDGALIDGPTTNNGLFFNSGEGDIIAEEGASAITANITGTYGTIKIETKAGATLSTIKTDKISTVGTKTGEGLLLQRIVDKTRWGGGAAPANYDGVELYSSGSHESNDNEIFKNSSFAGYLKVTTKDGDYRSFAWFGAGSFDNPVFSGRPTLELAGDMRIYQSNAEKPFTVKNLSGTGDIYNFNDTDNKTFKYIDTLQTKDTTYSGIVKNISSCSNCDPSLTVRGADDATAIYSLTLSGVSDTTAPLTIENNAKVVFSSIGKWSGGTVTVQNGGVLESQNSAAVAPTVELQEGATIALASGVPLTATGITIPSGTVYVDMSAFGLAEGSSATIMSATTLTGGANVGNLESTSGYYTFAVDPQNNNAIKATNMGTCVWDDDSWNKADPSLYSDVIVNVAAGGTTLTLDDDYSFDSITLSGSSGSLTIAANGHTLTVGDIIVPNGVTLVASSALTVNGSLSGGGTVVVPDGVTFICPTGTTWNFAGEVYVQSGGELVVNGTLNLTKSNGSSVFWGLRVYDGGRLTLNSTGSIDAQDWVNQVHVDGDFAVAGNYIGGGDLRVGSTGSITVSDSGSFYVAYGIDYDGNGNLGTITIPSINALKNRDNTAQHTTVKNTSTGKVVFKPTDADVGVASIGAFSDYVVIGEGRVEIDVTNLTLPTGTDKLTLFSTTPALDLTKFSVTGNSDYYLQQNAQDAETNPGAVTLQLYSLKDNNGGYYRDANSALGAIVANHALTLTILDGTEEDWTAEAISPFGLERSGTSVYYVAARIGSTPYNSVQGAVDAAENGQTITLATSSNEAITLNNKSIVFDEGSYTFSGSFTGNGTLALTALLKSADSARWAEGWTGTVVLPEVDSMTNYNFNMYGNSLSKVRVQRISGGWLNVTELGNPNKSRQQTTVEIGGEYMITAMSGYDYIFDKITGTGSISFATGGTQPNTIAITTLEVPESTAGVAVTNSTTKAVTIGKLVLPSMPACDVKVLTVGGTGPISLDVSNIKVGEASLPAKYKLERRDDGFYVYYNGTIFSVY